MNPREPTRVLFGALLVALAVPVSAVPVFNDGVEVQSPFFSVGGGGISGSPTTTTLSRSSFPYSATATSTSGAGFISGAASASNAQSTGFAFARTTPFMTIDDVLITKLDPNLPDVIDVTLQATVVYDETNSVGDLDVSVGLNSLTGNSIFLASSGSAVIQHTATVDITNLLTVHLGADMDGSVGGFGTATAEFFLRLGGSPVFLFPNQGGYTANSTQGNIVNNVWAGAPVPEPVLGPLLGLGLVGVAWRRSRRSDD